MKILITTTLNSNMTESKIKPLTILPEVQEIFYVSDVKGPSLEKVRYYCVPPGLLKLTNRNAVVRALSKFFIVVYLTLFKRPDFIMGYCFVPHGITAELVGRFFKIPSCINVISGTVGMRDGEFAAQKNIIIRKIREFLSRIFLKVAKRCSFIIVTGRSSRDFLIANGKVDREKVRIISATVDMKRFFLKRSSYKYDLVTIAQLIPSKKVDTFLEIVSKIATERPNIKVLILGDGILRDYLDGLSRKMGLGDIVEFAGFRPNVEDYLNASKVFLFPSRNEGLSLAMLEAMACGVVPVVSDVDDLSDAVEDKVSGRLLHRDDMDGFVSASLELLRDRDMLEVYSKNAIESVRRGYTIECASNKWKDILSQIKTNKRRRT